MSLLELYQLLDAQERKDLAKLCDISPAYLRRIAYRPALASSELRARILRVTSQQVEFNMNLKKGDPIVCRWPTRKNKHQLYVGRYLNPHGRNLHTIRVFDNKRLRWRKLAIQAGSLVQVTDDDICRLLHYEEQYPFGG